MWFKLREDRISLHLRRARWSSLNPTETGRSLSESHAVAAGGHVILSPHTRLAARHRLPPGRLDTKAESSPIPRTSGVKGRARQRGPRACRCPRKDCLRGLAGRATTRNEMLVGRDLEADPPLPDTTSPPNSILDGDIEAHRHRSHGISR